MHGRVRVARSGSLTPLTACEWRSIGAAMPSSPSVFDFLEVEIKFFSRRNHPPVEMVNPHASKLAEEAHFAILTHLFIINTADSIQLPGSRFKVQWEVGALS